MFNVSLPELALSLNIELLRLGEKLSGHNLDSAVRYILKHGLHASDCIHRCRNNHSKYKCIEQFKIAILEIDRAFRMIEHLHSRGLITKEDRDGLYWKCQGVRLATYAEIKRYYEVMDW